MEINKGPGAYYSSPPRASPLINPVKSGESPHSRSRAVTHGRGRLRATHLHKVKARQQRDAVFGGLLLGLVFGGRHLGGGPLAACGRIGKETVGRFVHGIPTGK